MKTIELYGEIFEVKYPRDGVNEAYPTYWDYTDIYQAYNNPSIYKVQIWDYWSKFGLPDDETQAFKVGIPFISSRNCFTFTVTANVYNWDYSFAGVMHITKEHNYLYLNK